MIDIREIRIGNLVKSFRHNILVEGVEKRGINYSFMDEEYEYLKDELYPITITEDILLQLGFKKEVDDIIKREYYRLRLNGFCIDINKWSNTLGRDYGIHIDNLCCDSVLSGDIQYLHQLQNYIYDATKQELNINDIL